MMFDMMLKHDNDFSANREIKTSFLEPWKLSEAGKDKLCRDVPLTEKYMREFAKWLDWDLLSEYQIMSKEFLREMRSKVNWYTILAKEKWDEQFIDENSKHIMIKSKPTKNELCWESIFQNNIRSKRFFFKYYENLNWKDIFNFSSIKGGQIFNTYKDYIRELGLYKKYMNDERFEMIVPIDFLTTKYEQYFDTDFAGNRIFYNR